MSIWSCLCPLWLYLQKGPENWDPRVQTSTEGLWTKLRPTYYSNYRNPKLQYHTMLGYTSMSDFKGVLFRLKRGCESE